MHIYKVEVCRCILIFFFNWVKDQQRRLFFSKEKLFNTIIHRYTESTIDYPFHFYKVVSFFPLWLIFCFCVLPQKIEQPHSWAVQTVKNVHNKNLVHPHIFCMERNYLCDESISNLIEYLVILKNEIKHSQCEKKCWEILFFCLFGIKVLSINKK